jgi:hypothetical protein
VVAVALFAGACSSTPSGTGTTTTTSRATQYATTTTSGTTPSTTTTAVPVSTTSTTVPFTPISGAVGEFYSPSHNINCEIDYATSGPQATNNGTMCLTVNPPQAVILSPSGGLRTCSGVGCLANAGVNTPVLAYGTATGAGPFRCVSHPTGMTCTVNGMQGFSIATSGITPIGGATVTSHGTTLSPG